MLDVCFIFLWLITVYTGYRRGLYRELLHAGMLTLTVSVSYFYILHLIEFEHISEIPTILWNLALYLGSVMGVSLVLTVVSEAWLLPRYTTPALQLLGAGFALCKLGGLLLTASLAFAIHNPNVDRLQYLPDGVQNSVFIQHLDALTGWLYQELARREILEYHKIVSQQPSYTDQQRERFFRQLGIKETPRLW